MQVVNINLSNQRYRTQASLTVYLQTPTPKSPVQEFPALVIVPGGSMTHITAEESEKTAIAFAARGFQTMILRYSFLDERNPLYPYPLFDFAQAMQTINHHRSSWHLSPQTFILGFSAGGHIAALFNDYWASSWLKGQTGIQEEVLKPTAIVLGYPVIDLDAGFPKEAQTLNRWTDHPERYNASQHVNDNNRPTFTWATMDDPFVPVQNSINYALALHAHNIPQELHLFAHGPHGMDIANSLVAHHVDGDQPHVAHWVDLACEWLLNH